MSHNEVKRLIDLCDDGQCAEIFKHIRTRVAVHPLEAQLNCNAEIILESMSRASDLTLRGIRGIITEVAFKDRIVDNLIGWTDITPPGDLAFDFLLRDGTASDIKIQVKMQRKVTGNPLSTPDGTKWIVETQRTRNGTKNGAATRPYKFGEWDILAVSLQPSTGNWDNFIYTVGKWLIPRPDDKTLIKVLQPVSKVPNDDWTDDLQTCIDWHRSGRIKTIAK